MTTTHSESKIETPKEHKPFVTITKGMRGWFAVCIWWNPDMGGFWEPWQTGDSSYASPTGAEKDARDWAEAEGIEFRSTML